jgi:glucose-1-phosphate cytidylyltransferase
MKIDEKKICVVLCGGKGTRMGSLTKKKPKPLLKVKNKPIIWYVLKFLIKSGFNEFIFPLGYRGDQIRNFIKKEFSKNEINLIFKKTGINSSISKRIWSVNNMIPSNANFLLINSDTLVDFNINDMIKSHVTKNKLITLSYVDLKVKWGLIVKKKNELISFDRKRSISTLNIKNSPKLYGLINSGIAYINKYALSYSKKNDSCFETALYSRIIKKKRLGIFKINGQWYPIDTENDLNTINLKKNFNGI